MKTILILTFLFARITINAQNERFTVNSERFTFYPLEGMAESIGLEKGLLAFGYNTDGDTIIIAVLGDKKETEVIGYSQNEYIFNYAKMNDPEWRNDSVFISSEMPYRATQVFFGFVWDEEKKGFFVTETETIDPSWDAVARADSALIAGDLLKAIDNYYQVMYPHAYINEGEVGIKLMHCAHEKALEYFKGSKYDSAVIYMELALDYYPNSNYNSFKDADDFKTFMQDSSTWQIVWNLDQCKLWLGDYGLFLYKAGQLERSIDLNSYLNMILPDVAGPYLQLGDSYYDSGKKTEAKTTYKKYIELKKSQKKENEIPKRVKERSK